MTSAVGGDERSVWGYCTDRVQECNSDKGDGPESLNIL